MGASEPAARALGFWTSVALVVGNTIGAGIFVMPAALAPFGLNALTGWLVILAGCLCMAVVFAGLGRAFPQDDGPYGYLRRAFGDGPSFLILWCYWVSTWVTNAVIAIGVVGYMSTFVPALARGHWLPPLAAILLVWLFVLINLCGLRIAAWTQVLTTALKLIPQAGIIVLGLWQLLTHPGAYLQHVPPNPITLPQTMRASNIALFAMLGIECAIIPASKVLNPERNVPRATLIGALLVALIYISVSVVPLLLIPQQVLISSNAPFADLFGQFLGASAAKWVAAFIIISGLGAMNGWTLIVGEVTQNFARHGDFPRALGKLNRRGAPWPAFVLAGAAASLMLLLNYSDSTSGAFAYLGDVVSLDNMPLYLGCALTVLILYWRARAPAERRAPLPRRVDAALVGALFCISIIVTGGKSTLWAFALGAVGIPIQLWSMYRRRPAYRAARRAL